MSNAAQKNEFLGGVKAELPIALGVIPFGMIYGVLALAAGMSPALAQAMSAIVFAGSAQFIGAQLIGAATPGPILLFTIFIVNIRHLLYSASLAPHLKHLPAQWRWLLAYLLTDEAYAVTVLHYDRGQTESTDNRHFFFLGAGLTLWIAWQTSTAVGIFLGTQVPASWALDFTLALTFIGIVIPALKDKAHIGAALSAGVTAVLAAALPYKLGLMLAALIGIIVGMTIENQRVTHNARRIKKGSS